MVGGLRNIRDSTSSIVRADTDNTGIGAIAKIGCNNGSSVLYKEAESGGG